MMLLHHLIYDLRYLFGLDVFAFQETWWFENLLRPTFLNVFLVVSGICCTFSRSNLRRGLRLLLVAAAVSVVSAILSLTMTIEVYVLFNVLHLLAIGTLLYAGLTRRELAACGQAGNSLDPAAPPSAAAAGRNQTAAGQDPRLDVILLVLTAVLLYAGSLIPDLQQRWGGNWLTLPFGLLPASRPGMADYLPIIPWLGFFLVGALVGRRLYARCQTAFPGAPGWLLSATRPFEFIGRNSLWFYALHQPVLIGLLSGLRALSLF